MSLKKYSYDKNIEMCLTCKFIDEYAFNVYDEGEVPHGYDGMAVCNAYDKNQPEDSDNMMCVSPLWKACKKYVRCTLRQAQYLDIHDLKTNKIIKNPNDISKIDEDE